MSALADGCIDPIVLRSQRKWLVILNVSCRKMLTLLRLMAAGRCRAIRNTEGMPTCKRRGCRKGNLKRVGRRSRYNVVRALVDGMNSVHRLRRRQIVFTVGSCRICCIAIEARFDPALNECGRREGDELAAWIDCVSLYTSRRELNGSKRPSLNLMRVGAVRDEIQVWSA